MTRLLPTRYLPNRGKRGLSFPTRLQPGPRVRRFEQRRQFLEGVGHAGGGRDGEVGSAGREAQTGGEYEGEDTRQGAGHGGSGGSAI